MMFIADVLYTSKWEYMLNGVTVDVLLECGRGNHQDCSSKAQGQGFLRRQYH